MTSDSLKATFIYHMLFLCIGPAIVLISSLFGADWFDDFTHETSGFTTLFKFGVLLMIIIPIIVVLRGILLAVSQMKENKRWLLLPISTLIFSILIFPLVLVLNLHVSIWSDCYLAHEDNPAKCGY
jgi:hypothetical protein